VTYVALAGNIIAMARTVWRVYDGLRLDDNDGEFALWSEDDLIVALHALGKSIDAADAYLRRGSADVDSTFVQRPPDA
jgi:hypothetical protein